MSLIEIILLAVGAALFVISYLVPAGQEKTDGKTSALAQGEVKKLVAQEMETVREHIDDVVEEAVGYAMEKTERSLERLSNEKIMAVNEYSDTVLQEIHKNHEEVMFLYDMLNNKHSNLKDTVSQVNKTVKEVAETKKEAEVLVNHFQKWSPQKVERAKTADMLPEADKGRNRRNAEKSGVPINSAGTQFTVTPEQVSGNRNRENKTAGRRGARNNNEKILELYKQGKTNVAIAKELGLGVGEVRLVIELFKDS